MEQIEQPLYYTTIKTKLCLITLVGNGEGLRYLFLGEAQVLPDHLVYQPSFFKQWEDQLDEYFKGERQIFDLPLNIEGTSFQKKVWQALREIPYGETCSYKDVAIKIGQPQAARAVGGANNKNPLPLVIPCHRVIGQNGKMVGYAKGIKMKVALLNQEKRGLT